ncbi:hypothetical protein E4U42_004807 [Claviceps africana]|uniref:Uncharacterized protein n=1 Tax=Claviceps africana TaxID=83212 RepID=A0A8K0NHU1_9HYPO|nr:hypothetical protein E4U42_004807 [Claviceps africana]
MSSVKDWIESLAEVHSRNGTCPQQPFVAGPSARRISETCLVEVGVNNSETTLVNALDMDNMACCDRDQERQRQLSTSSAASREREQGTGKNTKDQGSIECRVDYYVVEDDRFAGKFGNYTGIWAGETGDAVPQTRSRYFGDHIHQSAYYHKP